jgi:hypothetical protein
VTDARVALVRELERADEDVAALLAELDELYAACEAVRTRALAVETFFARLPAERTAREQALGEARATVERAEEAARRAADELARAERAAEEERRAAARRFDVRARDALAGARRRLATASAERERLESGAAEAEREAQTLEERARVLAAALRRRPRLAADAGAAPGAELGGVSEWGGRARAALLVARAGLAAERDALIRQANELGSAVLGEPLAPARAHDVARRVERALANRSTEESDPRPGHPEE